MKADDRAAFDGVVNRIAPDSRLLATRILEGGVSARTVAVEFERVDGSRETVVVGLHGEVDRASNPNVAADEFKLLQIVSRTGVPIPAPRHLDTSRELFEIPYLVTSFIVGSSEFDPADIRHHLYRLAEGLVEIHRQDWPMAELRFLPQAMDRVERRIRSRPEVLDTELSEGRIRAVLESRWPLSPSNPRSLLHGDFWPGNILWRGGEIAAILDWEDAAIGDPLIDLGNCRFEIFWTLGREATQLFTNRYQELLPALNYTHLPFWDLYAALRPAGKLAGWGLDAETEVRMQALHREFVEQALGG